MTRGPSPARRHTPGLPRQQLRPCGLWLWVTKAGHSPTPPEILLCWNSWFPWVCRYVPHLPKLPKYTAPPYPATTVPGSSGLPSISSQNAALPNAHTHDHDLLGDLTLSLSHRHPVPGIMGLGTGTGSEGTKLSIGVPARTGHSPVCPAHSSNLMVHSHLCPSQDGNHATDQSWNSRDKPRRARSKQSKLLCLLTRTLHSGCGLGWCFSSQRPCLLQHWGATEPTSEPATTQRRPPTQEILLRAPCTDAFAKSSHS